MLSLSKKTKRWECAVAWNKHIRFGLTHCQISCRCQTALITPCGRCGAACSSSSSPGTFPLHRVVHPHSSATTPSAPIGYQEWTPAQHGWVFSIAISWCLWESRHHHKKLVSRLTILLVCSLCSGRWFRVQVPVPPCRRFTSPWRIQALPSDLPQQGTQR